MHFSQPIARGVVVSSPRDAPKSSTALKNVLSPEIMEAIASSSSALLGTITHHPSADSLSLWQLLLACNSGEAERNEILSLHYSVQASVPLSSLASNLEISKALDVRELIFSNNMRRAHLDEGSTHPGECFLMKMYCCRRVCLLYREKFLRTEILRNVMIHGMHKEGVLQDSSSSGSAVNLPLWISRERTSFRTVADKDAHLSKVYQIRMDNIFSHDVLEHVDELFHELSKKGGVITKPVYFGLMVMFYKVVFPHLKEVELHQLISQEFVIDCYDANRILSRLESKDPKRKSSLRNLFHFASQKHSNNSDIHGDTLEVLSRHQFQRFIGSLSFVWVESNSVSEVSMFVGSLRKLWVSRVETIDLDFATKYQPSSDYISPQQSLLPVVPRHVFESDAEVVVFATEEILRAIFLRFPMYSCGKEEILKDRRKQLHDKFSLPRRSIAVGSPSGGDVPSFATESVESAAAKFLARRSSSKFQAKRLTNDAGWMFGPSPLQETKAVVTTSHEGGTGDGFEEEIVVDAPLAIEMSGQCSPANTSTLSFHCPSPIPNLKAPQSEDRWNKGTWRNPSRPVPTEAQHSRGSDCSDQQPPVTVTYCSTSRAFMETLTSLQKESFVNREDRTFLVPLDVSPMERNFRVAPTVRQVQYTAFVAKPRETDSFGIHLFDGSLGFGSRLVPSRQSVLHDTALLPRIMQRHYQRQRDGTVGPNDVLRQLMHCQVAQELDANCREISAAACGAKKAQFAPVIRAPKIKDPSGVSLDGLRNEYDLGLVDMRSQLARLRK